ncbi:hypothetical protein IWW50_006456, partial [Coemansia erecta]
MLCKVAHALCPSAAPIWENIGDVATFCAAILLFSFLFVFVRARLGIRTVQAADAELEKAEFGLATVMAKLAAAEAQQAITNDRLAKAETQLTGKKKELAGASATIAAVTAKLEAAKAQQATTNDKLTAAEAELQTTATAYAKECDASKTRAAKFEEITKVHAKRQRNWEAMLNNAKNELVAKCTELAAAEDKINGIEKKLAVKNVEVQIVEAKLSSKEMEVAGKDIKLQAAE